MSLLSAGQTQLKRTLNLRAGVLFFETPSGRVPGLAKILVSSVLSDLCQEQQKHQLLSYKMVSICQVDMKVNLFTAFLSWDSADFCELDIL